CPRLLMLFSLPIPRPPRSTLFPSRRSSDLKIPTGRDALRQALRSMSPDRLTVALDGKSAEEEVLLLEVMRIPSVGPRLRLVPQAHPGDGRFYVATLGPEGREVIDRQSTRLNSSHVKNSYAVFC